VSLRVEEVSLALGGHRVLSGASLEVEAGEIVGLLGPNGAGKTSLLRVASGVSRPDAGSVQWAGRLLGDWPLRERARQLAVVPQECHVPFPFRAGELVLMGRAPYRGWFSLESPADVRLAMAALERMGIAHLANRSIADLSGGERQLVLIARALVQEPRCLLLDEPTAFLDLAHRIEVLGVVRELADQGCAVLLVSHDLSLAARSCDRLALLSEGRVVVEGSPREVLDPVVLRRVFGFEAQVLEGPDGFPLVLPEILRR